MVHIHAIHDWHSAILTRLRSESNRSGLWEEFNCDLACLDAELMSLSTKAQASLRDQNVPIGYPASLSAEPTRSV